MLLWLHVSFRCLAVLNKMKLIRLACTANILFKENLLPHESLLHQTADWNSSFLPWEGQQIKLQSYINICGRNVERCYFGAIQVQIWAKLHQSHNCLLNLTKHVGAPNVKLKGRLFIRHTESGITIVMKQLAGFNTSSKKVTLSETEILNLA